MRKLTTSGMNQTITIIVTYMVPYFIVDEPCKNHYNCFCTSLQGKVAHFAIKGSTKLLAAAAYRALAVLRWYFKVFLLIQGQIKYVEPVINLGLQ